MVRSRKKTEVRIPYRLWAQSNYADLYDLFFFVFLLQIECSHGSLLLWVHVVFIGRPTAAMVVKQLTVTSRLIAPALLMSVKLGYHYI